MTKANPLLLETEQERQLQSMTDIIAAAQARIDAIDPNLKPEVVAERIEAIRAEVAPKIGEKRKAMQEHAAFAHEAMSSFTPAAVKRAARFNKDDATNASMANAAYARLSRTNTGELVREMEDAVRSGNVTMSEAVRREFDSREDKGNFARIFAELAARVEVPEAAEATRALKRVAGLVSVADTDISRLLSGRSRPEDRIAEFRQAGRPRAA